MDAASKHSALRPAMPPEAQQQQQQQPHIGRGSEAEAHAERGEGWRAAMSMAAGAVRQLARRFRRPRRPVADIQYGAYDGQENADAAAAGNCCCATAAGKCCCVAVATPPGAAAHAQAKEPPQPPPKQAPAATGDGPPGGAGANLPALRSPPAWQIRRRGSLAEGGAALRRQVSKASWDAAAAAGGSRLPQISITRTPEWPDAPAGGGGPASGALRAPSRAPVSKAEFLSLYARGSIALDPLGKVPPANSFAGDPTFQFLRAPKPPDDDTRLSNLAGYGLTTAPDPNMTRIVELGKAIFKSETCVFSIIDKYKHWFKACVGIPNMTLDRNVGFCAHTILRKDQECFVVSDAQNDWRFANHPLVVGKPYLRFYAGAPVRSEEGHNIGVVCVSDRTPRVFSAADAAVLKGLASAVARELTSIKEKNFTAVLQRHQELIAHFSKKAPFKTSIRAIFRDACQRIANTMETEIVFVLEATDAQKNRFIVRAAEGLQPVLAAAAPGPASSAGAPAAEFAESDESRDSHVQMTSFRRRNSSYTPSARQGMPDRHLLPASPQAPGAARRKRQTASELLSLSVLDDVMSSLDNMPSSVLRGSSGCGFSTHTDDDQSNPDSAAEPAVTHEDLAGFLYPEGRGFAVSVSAADSTKIVPFNMRKCQNGFDEEQDELVLSKVNCLTAASRAALAAEPDSHIFILGAFTKSSKAFIVRHMVDMLVTYATAISAATQHHRIQVALNLNKDAIRSEKDVLSRLIDNILPPLYVERLKSEQRAMANKIPDCSIIFADIVGFTSMSLDMQAKELVALLNKIFIRFDLICKSFGVEKIKTIGDCYMAGAGVPEYDEHHARVAAEFCLALLACFRSLNAKLNTSLEIRVGINSGPLVAGVIGLTKFSYDVWGNTVNIAQRMQAGSEPGKINVSASTYEALKDKYRFTPRGSCKVKGAGEMQMFFLEGRISETYDENGLLPQVKLVEDIERDVAETVAKQFAALHPNQGAAHPKACSTLGSLLEFRSG